MSSNFGKLCRDGHFGSITVKDVTVIDANTNIRANSIKITGGGGLKTDCITAKTSQAPVVVKSDLCVESGWVLQTDCVDAKGGNGIRMKDSVCLDSGQVLKVANQQVVTNRQPPIPLAISSGLNNVTARVNDIISALSAHGLIYSGI